MDNHWRKTPFFKELVLWDIPEESARVAGFQTGQLDTFTMSFDSIPTVEAVPGTEFMSVPGGGESHLGLYGSSYVGLGTDDQRPTTQFQSGLALGFRNRRCQLPGVGAGSEGAASTGHLHRPGGNRQ